MMYKYLIINSDCDEVYAVEISEHQRDAMQWLLDKLDLNNHILFIRVDNNLTFKEI